MNHPNPYEARARKREMEEARKVFVVAKCVSCGVKRKIRDGEVENGRQPTCHECYMPMVATEARAEG